MNTEVKIWNYYWL